MKEKKRMDNFNPGELAQKILEAVKKEYDSLKTLNVMILGKTGVGKSTLINNMFNENLAETGVGKPVTPIIRKIEKPGYPLAIYDTPGLELSGENGLDALLEEVVGEIQKGITSGDVGSAVHVIWYCVSTPSHRIEESEMQFIRDLHNRIGLYHIPVIVVLTQSFSKKDSRELFHEIEKENLPIVNIVPILAEDYAIDEDYTAKAYGLDKLSELMNSVIPEAVRNTFIAVQCANLELKNKRARNIILAAATTAGATGAVPIPFSDAFLLVPEQIAMIAGITAAFGIPVDKGTISAIVSCMVGISGTTFGGKAIVSGLLKLIPGVGSALGATISAATATALTTALGEAYILIMNMICKGEMKVSDLQTEAGKEIISGIFKKQLSLKRDKDGNVVD